MGLDITNSCIDNYDDDISYYIEEYLSSEYTKMFTDYLHDKEYDKIINEVTIEHIDRAFATAKRDDEEISEEELKKALENYLEMFKSAIESIKNKITLIGETEISSEDKAIAEKYSWVYEDDEVQDSRMGSYSMIHYGRKFADLVDDLYKEKGLSISDTDQEITREEVENLLSRIESEGTTSYNADYFDNLCNHSDCDGCYIPTEERLSFDEGSSILLLRELDTLYKIKAVDRLKEIIASIETEYKGRENVQFATEEVRLLHRYAENCEWVIRKMLFHAVSSVEGEEIIVFC